MIEVIKITISNQSSKVELLDTIYSNNSGQYKVHFIFDDDSWDNYNKMVVFDRVKNYDTPIGIEITDENTNLVEIVSDREFYSILPWEVITQPGYFNISIYGTYTNEKGELLTKNYIISERFTIQNGGDVIIYPKVPTPNMYEQLRNDYKITRELASEAKNIAEDGKEIAEDASNRVKEIEDLLEEGVGVGEKTEQGGEIFNDYENNKALGEYTHVEGKNNIAGATATGFKVSSIVVEEFEEEELYDTSLGEMASIAHGFTDKQPAYKIQTLIIEEDITSYYKKEDCLQFLFDTEQYGDMAKISDIIFENGQSKIVLVNKEQKTKINESSRLQWSYYIFSTTPIPELSTSKTNWIFATRKENEKEVLVPTPHNIPQNINYDFYTDETILSEGAHAQGIDTIACAKGSFTGGIGTIASEEGQTSLGKYNKEDSDALFIVGNGESEEERSNAFVVKKNGAIIGGDYENNLANVESAAVFGSHNTVGIKAFKIRTAYYTGVGHWADETPTYAYYMELDSIEGLEVGDVVSIKIPSKPLEGKQGAYLLNTQKISRLNPHLGMGGNSGEYQVKCGFEISKELFEKFNNRDGLYFDEGYYCFVINKPTIGTTYIEGEIGGFATGYGNVVDRAFANGAHNFAGNNSNIFGNDNVGGTQTTIFGNNNFAENGSFIVGETNEARQYCSNAIGKSLKTGAGYQTVTGKYNDPKSYTVFEVGAGTSNTDRRNGFEVHTDGHAEVFAQGNTKKSVVQKQYVDGIQQSIKDSLENEFGINTPIFANDYVLSKNLGFYNGMMIEIQNPVWFNGFVFRDNSYQVGSQEITLELSITAKFGNVIGTSSGNGAAHVSFRNTPRRTSLPLPNSQAQVSLGYFPTRLGTWETFTTQFSISQKDLQGLISGDQYNLCFDMIRSPNYSSYVSEISLKVIGPSKLRDINLLYDWKELTTSFGEANIGIVTDEEKGEVINSTGKNAWSSPKWCLNDSIVRPGLLEKIYSEAQTEGKVHFTGSGLGIDKLNAQANEVHIDIELECAETGSTISSAIVNATDFRGTHYIESEPITPKIKMIF